MCSNSIKFEQNRTICCRVIDDLAHFRREIVKGVPFTRNDLSLLRGAWTEIHQTWRGHRPSSVLTEFVQISDILLHFQTRAVQRRVVSKMKPNFALFDPTVKITGVVGEISGSMIVD